MARRVNTNFLIILTVLVVGLGTAALIAPRFLKTDKPEKFEAAAKKALQEKKYDEALRNFAIAAQLDDHNPQRMIDYGDVHYQLSGKDIESLFKARKAWERALELDPANKPALQRILKYNQGFLELDPGPKSFDVVREAAQKLLLADPSNVTAAAALYGTQIRAWIYGVETDPARIDALMTKLAELCAKDPTNAEAPFWLGRAKAQRAADVRRQGNSAETLKSADQLTNDAIAVMDEALKHQDTAVIHYHTGQVLISLEQAQIGNDEPTRARRKSLRDRRNNELARARELAKPEDEQFEQIYRVSADIAQAEGERDSAEKILRELVAKIPNNQFARLSLAELLSHLSDAKREEAAALLEKEVGSDAMPGPRALQNRLLQNLTLERLTDLRIEQFTLSTTEQRAKLLPKIDDGINKLIAKGGETPGALLLRGKLQRLQGKSVEAIETLKRAQTLVGTSGSKNYQVMEMLARAYIDARQSGRAKTILTEIVDNQPENINARVLLTQLLLQERSLDLAKGHIDMLERVLPNEPEIIRMRLVLLSMDTPRDDKKIGEYYANLPEKTGRDQVSKAQIALGLNKKDEAIRLLSATLAADSGNMSAAQVLVPLYLEKNMRTEALQIVIGAQKANPNDPTIDTVRQVIEDASVNEPAERRQKMVDALKDPFMQAMLRASIAREQNKPLEQLKYLLEAEKINPDNIGVKQQLFQYYYATRNAADASKFIDALSAANADKAGGLVYRFRLAMMKNDLVAATTHARALIETKSDFAQSWVCMGQVQQAQGQIEDALSKYLAARDRQSENPEALRGIIECSYGLNRPDDALRYIEEGLRKLPGNPYLREAKLAYDTAYRDPASTIAPREAAIKAEPGNPQNWVRLISSYVAAARKLGDDPGAKDFITKAMQTSNDAMTKFPEDGRFYASYAEASMLAKTPDLGEAAIKKYIALDTSKGKLEPQVMLAEFYYRSGQAAKAEELLRQLVASFPANVELELTYVSVLTELKKTNEALAALSVNPDDPRVVRQKIQLLVELNRIDDAAKALEDALKKTPNAVDLLAMQGSLQLQRSKFPEAEASLKQAMAIDPNSTTVRYFMGLLRLRQPVPDVDEAIVHLSFVRDQAPTNLDGRLALAGAYKRKNDPAAVIREVEATLAVAPANKRVRLAAIEAYRGDSTPRWSDIERVLNDALKMPQFKSDPEMMQAAATMWEDRGNLERAADFLRQAIDAAPGNPGVVRQYMELLIKARNFPAAIQMSNKILDGKFNPWWAYEARAIAYRNTPDKKDEAIEDFEAALDAAIAEDQGSHVIRSMVEQLGADVVLERIVPRAATDNRWRMFAAYLYQGKNDEAGAIKMLDQIMAEYDKLTPALKKSALQLGGQLYTFSKPEMALEMYTKLIALQPDDLTSLNNIACLLADQLKRPADALKYSQRAYDICISNNLKQPAIFDTHGWVLTLNNRVDEGIDLLRQSIETSPILDAHYHLAQAYVKKSIPQEAQLQLLEADKMIKAADEKKQPIDPGMRSKVEAANAQVKEMLKAKQQAQVP